MPPDPTSAELTDADGEELRILYSVSVADIAFFKQQQQWSVTNHSLALHAAFVLTAYQLLKPPLADWRLGVLILLTWVICVTGIVMIERLQDSISGRRTRLERVRAHFGERFRRAWDIEKPKDDVHWLLRAVVLLSSGVVTWLLIAR